MARKRTNLADDTCIVPEIVAEGVVQELALAFEDVRGEMDGKVAAFLDSASAQRAFGEGLAKRAEETYAANAAFAKKMNADGDAGRDGLYAFMRHWAAAKVKEDFGAAAFQALPEGFAAGREPAPRSAPGMR